MEFFNTMRVLVLHSHPLDESFGRALYRQTCESLTKAGHEVDGCNLYAEGFDPVLSAHDRTVYHDYPENTVLVKDYVDRLQKAEGLVIVTPVWMPLSARMRIAAKRADGRGASGSTLAASASSAVVIVKLMLA